MHKLAALLQWADDNDVRVTWKFIPHHKPNAFVVEAHVPRPEAGAGYSQFIRKKGRTVEDVCDRFLRSVK